MPLVLRGSSHVQPYFSQPFFHKYYEFLLFVLTRKEKTLFWKINPTFVLSPLLVPFMATRITVFLGHPVLKSMALVESKLDENRSSYFRDKL